MEIRKMTNESAIQIVQKHPTLFHPRKLEFVKNAAKSAVVVMDQIQPIASLALEENSFMIKNALTIVPKAIIKI